MKNEKTRGGLRPNAGRKPHAAETKNVTLALDIDAAELLDIMQRSGQSKSSIVSDLIREQFSAEAEAAYLSISELTELARGGRAVRRLTLINARDHSDAEGSEHVNDTIYWRKYVTARDGDEIVVIGKKQFNVSEFRRLLEAWRGLECSVWVSGEDRYRVGTITN